MKIIKIIMVTTLLFVTGYADFVSAHSQSGALGRNNSKAAATDQYMVFCSNLGDGTGVPDHLFLRVKDLPPRNPARISIQAQYTDPLTGAVIVTPISTDPRDGDAGLVPGITLAAGAGPYVMTVTKTRSTVKGREIYLAEFHCQSSIATGDQHTGTDWTMIQNQ